MQPRSPFRIVRSVVFALVLRDMQARLAGSHLGLFKVILEPLLHLAFMLTIFGVMRAGMLPGVDYPVFLIAGIAPFLLFKNIVLRLMGAIDANSALFAYRQIKPFDVFVSRAMVECLLSSTVYVIVLLALGWMGETIAIPRPLEWMVTLLLGLAFAFALGILCAILVRSVPELDMFVRIAFMPLYLISGVIFPVTHVPEVWVPYLSWNPFLHLIELIRADAIQGYSPVPWVSTEYPACLTILMLFCALALYRVRRFALIAK